MNAPTNITETLAQHALWLRGEGGKRANLSWADLSWADLRRADLSWADLRRANLSGADLSWAAIREGIKLGRNIGSATRGDRYTFHAFETDAGETFFFAGCRAFLRSEFEAHIEAEYPGTAKAKATRACLDYLESLRADFGDAA